VQRNAPEDLLEGENMSDMPGHLIRSAQNTLERAAAGLESAGTVDAGAVDKVFERARRRSGLGARRAGIDGARAALASAYLEEGRRGLAEVAAKGEQASLTEPQRIGLEAIVRLTGRPSFLVKDDAVTSAHTDSDWADDIVAAAEAIRGVVTRVGRVNLPQVGEPGYVGTAFLVGADLAMTNRHVAVAFGQAKAGGTWAIGAGMTPSVDFNAEQGARTKRSYKVTGIALLHPDPMIDMALLRLATKSAKEKKMLPSPLGLDKSAGDISPKRQVYVVGYPASDSRNNASAMHKIFGEVFFVKRFAPGEIMAKQNGGRQFTHDCSTLGGNSGSCVVDFSTHRVSGLHFGGSYLVENRAVALHKLRNDPKLAGKGLNFR
jgi:V8-like Glu-specific endopeptidase